MNKSTERRLPPISLAFEVASGIRQQLVPAIIALISASTGSMIGSLIAIAFFGLSVSAAVFRYFSTRIRIDEDVLEVESGLFFRVHKTIPLENVQNIDLVQNLFHRFLSVAEVRVETASGREPEAVLKVLSMADIVQLRSSVAARRQSLEVFEPNRTELSSSPTLSAGPVREGSRTLETILTLPLGRLALAGLIANHGWALFLVPLGLLWESRMFTEGNWVREMRRWSDWAFQHAGDFHWGWTIAGLVIVGLTLLKLFSIAWHVMRFYGYRLEADAEELRVSCGLFTQVTAAVKRERVQLVSIHRSLFGRMLGIASIRLETAGGGAEEDAASTVARRWFVPILFESELPSVLSAIRPGLVWSDPSWRWQSISPKAERRMRRKWILLCTLWLVPIVMWQSWWFLAAIPITIIAGWMISRRTAKSLKYVRTEDGLIYRSGFWTKKCSISFFDKIQTVKLSSSPFDRRWAMASLSIDTVAAGPADHRIHVPMLDASLAVQERDAILARIA
ncbi:MAG: PH domain-containing protein [Pirellulales bacterium]